MKTIEDQIREYASYADEQMAWVETDDLLGPQTRSARHARPGVVAFAAAAVVVTVAIGAIPLLTFGSNSPASSEPSAPSTTQSQSTTTTVTPEVVDSRYVGAETSIGTLTWTETVGGANSCPPRVRVDEQRGGYYSTWCLGGVLHSTDGFTWTEYVDFPSHDAEPDLYGPPVLTEGPSTVPVELGIWMGEELQGNLGPDPVMLITRANFGWVASYVPHNDRDPAIWISVDGETWELVEPPPQRPTTRLVWASQGGGAGDILYFGYVTRDYQNGNYLWVGHFSHP